MAQRRRRPTIRLPGAMLTVLTFVLVALVWVALVLHSAGLIYRMVLEGRPPVTLCGRNSVQIHERSRAIDFAEISQRLQPHGMVRHRIHLSSSTARRRHHHFFFSSAFFSFGGGTL